MFLHHETGTSIYFTLIVREKEEICTRRKDIKKRDIKKRDIKKRDIKKRGYKVEGDIKQRG
jgi:hypothetical protein